MFESKKIQESNTLPQGIWVDEKKDVGWEEIEAKSWNMILHHGIDFKLITLWSQSYVLLNGLKGLDFVFDSLLRMFKGCTEIWAQDEEQNFSLIKYLDKTLASAISEANLNFGGSNLINLLKFENFNLDNFNDFKENVLYISNDSFLALEIKVREIRAKFDDLANYLHENQYDLSKTKHLVHLLESFLEYRQEIVKQGNQIDETPQKISYIKEDAFERIDQAITILEDLNIDTLALPLLKKALSWQNLSVLEVLNDIGQANEIEALLRMLR